MEDAPEGMGNGEIPICRSFRGPIQGRKGVNRNVQPHAPEVECIGKGKAAKSYAFGCKVTVATTNARAKGGQFVVHINALHGNPYDGHKLKAAVENVEAWTCVTAKRIYVDMGYRGHGLERSTVWRSGNKTPTAAIRRELHAVAPSNPSSVT